MRKINKMPIAYQLYLLAFFIILIISVIFTLSYYFISKSIISTNINYTSQVFDQMQINIKDKTTLLENLLYSTGYKRYVFEYIMEEDNSKKYDELQLLDNQSINITQTEPNIQEVVIEGFNEVSYYSNGRTDDVYQALQHLPEETMNYYDFSSGLTYKKNGEPYFLVSTSIYDIWKITGHNLTARATLVVDMNLLGIDDFKNDYGTKLFMLDKNYQICTSNQSEIDEEVQSIINRIQTLQKNNQEININGISYIVNTNYLDFIDVYMLSITPKANILSSILWIKNLTFYLLLIALGLIITTFMIFNHVIVSPMKKFGVFMNQIKRGNSDALKRQVHLKGYKEIEDISDQFNNMIREINSLTSNLIHTKESLYATEVQKKQAELLYLKSQINPHFLFNTLEVILGMTYDEKAFKTAEMIKSLAKIFKYCVRGSDLVSLKEELNIIQSYIHIQQTRFFQSFEAHYEFGDEVFDQRIPKMLLQPMVENAINHGLVNREQKGNIYIGAEVTENNKMHLWVIDDGVGMDESKYHQLQSLIEKKTVRRSDSIGFENVIYRLQLIYGEDCNINLSSKQNEGTRIEITIPLLEQIEPQ